MYRALKGPPKGWVTLSADVNWEDHGGRWARRDRHATSKRAYNVCKFDNMLEHGIRDLPQYECGTGWIDLDDTHADIAGALRSCGWELHSDGVQIIQPYDGAIIASDARTRDLVILDAIIWYGGIDWDYEYAAKGARNLRARCVSGL